MSTENFLAVEFDIPIAHALGLECLLCLLRDCCRNGMPPDAAISAMRVFIHALANGNKGKNLKLWRATNWLIKEGPYK